jgi:hypothetical protein
MVQIVLLSICDSVSITTKGEGQVGQTDRSTETRALTQRPSLTPKKFKPPPPPHFPLNEILETCETSKPDHLFAGRRLLPPHGSIHDSRAMIHLFVSGAPASSLHTMAQRAAAVWVQLVIDNEAPDRYEAFVIKITSSETVDALEDAIMEKAKRRFDKDIHSLKVYPPGTKVPLPDEGAESIFPYLQISDPGFPSGISGQTPLIVTAKNRQQQVSLLLVSR